ncbi:MAG: DUF655 domain-containing protein [Candidatus Parvarchaeota archaeon]|nr:DUF655 domain-containing protein [Candidatus Jingweiarchaeum tengchongense]MCW1298234.1 DUF655 domain-containing protein [Candidatus Jingweiarchaeum tengchongense]MCW1300032.1 DUF655 domain-containing protein [Candidatus Jingweiarchaeum tengchongense]MCW1304829.1 DUF655 domain-containing protein [Candidatus Jingweiarchaeum tengchongense]MCW1305419.1 DUF655 domain-containing protein [Candidatus Jingweiarchaeum tengchongense]
MIKTQVKEDFGIVLDFLLHGNPYRGINTPVAQVLGEKHFILLEVAPKDNVTLSPNEKVYIGPEKRDKIHHIIGRIMFDDLTQIARTNLILIIEKLVTEREKEFVDFFNNAGPITTRLHQLELLPGIGKKHMWKILEERDEKPFVSFEDIKERIPLVPDPKRMIIKRILQELESKEKYKLFVG